MNDNRGAIWKWATGLLVLCNVALLATIWLKPSAPQEGGPRHETPRDYVIRNLRFTDEQIKNYDALITLHRRAMDSLGKDAMDSRRQLFRNLKIENGGILSPDSLAVTIAGIQKEIELVTYRHFAQVRTICRGEQLAQFDMIIGEVIKKMNGHGGPPPRGGRPGGLHDGPPPPPDDHEGPPPPDGPPQ